LWTWQFGTLKFVTNGKSKFGKIATWWTWQTKKVDLAKYVSSIWYSMVVQTGFIFFGGKDSS
jgi:hypothetical protein